MRKRRTSTALWVVAALLAVNAVLIAAQPGLALPRSLGAFFFGPGFVRAEIVMVVDGVLHDYRVDRGRVRAVGGGQLVLRERDGSLVTIPVAANAEILVNGRPAPLTAVRRGMQATTVRDGDAPAETVRAVRRR